MSKPLSSHEHCSRPLGRNGCRAADGETTHGRKTLKFGRFVLYPFGKRDIIAWWYKKGTLKLKRRGRRCSSDMQSIHKRPEESSGKLPNAASSVNQPHQKTFRQHTVEVMVCSHKRGSMRLCAHVCVCRRGGAYQERSWSSGEQQGYAGDPCRPRRREHPGQHRRAARQRSACRHRCLPGARRCMTPSQFCPQRRM